MIELDYNRLTLDEIKAMDTWIVELAGSPRAAVVSKFVKTEVIGQFRTALIFIDPEDELAFRLRFKI